MKLSLLKKSLVTFFTLAIMLFPLTSSAITPATIPFGGRLITPFVCTCSGNFLLTIIDFTFKTPITIMYQPFYSRLNSWYNFYTPGVYMLGQYHVGGICLMSVTGGDCEPAPIQPIGTITPFPGAGFGTGLHPLTQ